MYARTSTWKGSPDTLDRWAAHMRATVGPMVRELAGNSGAYFLVDRDAGRALTLTLWENEDAALQTDRNADASRDSTIAETGVEMVSRGRFEVVEPV
jgi:heme-degrading monooxygenase HmoA